VRPSWSRSEAHIAHGPLAANDCLDGEGTLANPGDDPDPRRRPVGLDGVGAPRPSLARTPRGLPPLVNLPPLGVQFVTMAAAPVPDARATRVECCE
jgi:hypothetical protein